MTIEQKIEIARSWIERGTFTNKGVTYTRDKNEILAIQELLQIMKVSVADLAFYFEELMSSSPTRTGKQAKGFSIGRGKKNYWYLCPTKNGTYTCYALEGNKLSYPRRLFPEQMVTIHY